MKCNFDDLDVSSEQKLWYQATKYVSHYTLHDDVLDLKSIKEIIEKNTGAIHIICPLNDDIADKIKDSLGSKWTPNVYYAQDVIENREYSLIVKQQFGEKQIFIHVVNFGTSFCELKIKSIDKDKSIDEKERQKQKDDIIIFKNQQYQYVAQQIQAVSNYIQIIEQPKYNIHFIEDQLKTQISSLSYHPFMIFKLLFVFRKSEIYQYDMQDLNNSQVRCNISLLSDLLKYIE